MHTWPPVFVTPPSLPADDTPTDLAAPADPDDKCKCSIDDLMIRGCTCGQMARERKATGQRPPATS